MAETDNKIEKCKTCFHLEDDVYCRCGEVNISEDGFCPRMCDHYLSREEGTRVDIIQACLAVCSGVAFTDGERRCWTQCPYYQEVNSGRGAVECKAKLMADALRVMKIRIVPVDPFLTDPKDKIFKIVHEEEKA